MMSPTAAKTSRSAGFSTSTSPGVWGPVMMPAAMKNGMVASPLACRAWPAAPLPRRRLRERRARWTSPSPGHQVDESGEVRVAAHHYKPVARLQHLVGVWGGHGLLAPHDGDHAESGLASDLQFGDRFSDGGGILRERDPVDDELTDDVLNLLDHCRFEEGAPEDHPDPPRLVVGELDRASGFVGVAVDDVEIASTGVVDDQDNSLTFAGNDLVAPSDPRHVNLADAHSDASPFGRLATAPGLRSSAPLSLARASALPGGSRSLASSTTWAPPLRSSPSRTGRSTTKATAAPRKGRTTKIRRPRCWAMEEPPAQWCGLPRRCLGLR